jgi:serine-type D-Ala-D-Ala carboxypeptidase (penicillin-binding protein 5/6)
MKKLSFLIIVLLLGGLLWWQGPLFLASFFSSDKNGKSSRMLGEAVPLFPEELRRSVPLPLPVNTDSLRFALPNAHAAYVIDAASGKVLYANKEHDMRQVASLTKIMTALVLMESGKSLNDIVTVDSDSINRAGTTIGCGNSGSCQHNTLLPGEKVYLRDLLKAMLMNSANDAASLIAKHVSGTEKDFVEEMNRRVKGLGLKETNFCTPNGLEPDGREFECHSSAHDMALIVRQALKYPMLWSIMRETEQTFTSVDGTREHRIFNTNQLLGQYGRMLGAKTGFTPLAGYSVLSVAEENGNQVIVVLLNDPWRWDDIRTVFDWAFASFQWL